MNEKLKVRWIIYVEKSKKKNGKKSAPVFSKLEKKFSQRHRKLPKNQGKQQASPEKSAHASKVVVRTTKDAVFVPENPDDFDLSGDGNISISYP